ncbi:HAMP domain-containing histidine kinase [Acuticoccus sediminis]|uniref:histidine kinase n=2 Tax=Acuticoccus sediminis TaxID=2184697 RepID=A0A8B2P1T5_9HYPH|nr:HAMP domain-containing histidine kinase [Acuticoccus sediminis]
MRRQDTGAIFEDTIRWPSRRHGRRTACGGSPAVEEAAAVGHRGRRRRDAAERPAPPPDTAVRLPEPQLSSYGCDSDAAAPARVLIRRRNMRISHSIFLVGAIPIVVAVAIAVAALVLLTQVERARNGASLAGSIYRNALTASHARDEYLAAQPDERAASAQAFAAATHAAKDEFDALGGFVSDPTHLRAVDDAENALERLTRLMDRLIAVTEANDARVADMAERAGRLVGLADEARRRQHVSNAELAATLGRNDQRLQLTRRVVDDAHALRTVASDLERRRLAPGAAIATQRIRLEFSRLSRAAAQLQSRLDEAGDAEARSELQSLANSYASTVEASPAGDADEKSAQQLIDWIDTLAKTNKTESDSLQAEVAELLTYSIEASETDQATQNIATEMLKVAEQTGRALAARDFDAIASAMSASRSLSERIATLPISPLIQTEMLDDSTAWRAGLATTAEDLKQQSELVGDMEAVGSAMLESVGSLNDLLIAHAQRIWSLARNILIGAAVLGLILAAALGFAVARSITRPLSRLQQEMLGLVDGTHSGAIAGAERHDELGDMARATTHFVTELTRREADMQSAKDAAHAALADLKRTQANLIQAEKLASLGQLVAGVAHEINTPLGVALTTATTMGPEVERFRTAAESGRLSRSVLDNFVERMGEGARLAASNLQRAANLVHSFKQVAVDQASGDRRTFRVAEWLDDLLVSLGPVLKKAGHRVVVRCPDDIEIDSYPGALGQVLTNLIVNALSHAYPPATHGTLTLAVTAPDAAALRIAFSDDGRGIAPEHQARVFDPFFTTGRSSGNTGLGLHIVYNLVTGRLGGRIALSSEAGAGTTFVIDLPRRAPLERAEPQSPNPAR